MTDGWILLGLWGPKSLDVAQRLVTVNVEQREIRGPLYARHERLESERDGCLATIQTVNGRSFGTDNDLAGYLSAWLPIPESPPAYVRVSD